MNSFLSPLKEVGLFTLAAWCTWVYILDVSAIFNDFYLYLIRDIIDFECHLNFSGRIILSRRSNHLTFVIFIFLIYRDVY